MMSIHRHIEEHNKVISAIVSQYAILEGIVSSIIHAFSNGGKLYILGNGGSAADAQHIAAEFIGRFKKNRKPLPAIALTTDTSILTAVTNDFGKNHMFARQVEGLVRAPDIVWALSVSGRSENIIEAIHVAQNVEKIYTIGFTGENGNLLNNMCDLCFIVNHKDSDRVQEAHQFAYHWICEQVENHFLENN